MNLFWTKTAWVDGCFQENVLLSANKLGFWDKVECGIRTPPEHAQTLNGYVLPGMVNAHSHAFQRAFAGMAEQRSQNITGSEQDNFWSWRDQMYQVALRINPAQLEAVATQLYVEMLQGGYTHVCEFHYLHHAPDGTSYADPLEMTWALVRAAKKTGIGLTLLPVLYERAGFAAPTLRHDQRRFASSPDSVWAIHQAVMHQKSPLLNAGVAVHSLRAASLASIQQLQTLVGDTDIPIHIHIAEQTGEVDDCLKATGKRPIDYLASHVQLDSRWQLVHATHAEKYEIDAIAKAGAGLVMCPTTEANLGDGITDMPYWLKSGVPLAIGSDSHVSRDWREELRWLEYAQRLQLRQRNVCADVFNKSIQGGGHAAGHAQWGLVVGARADALVLDPQAAGLLGVPLDRILDAYVFACDKSAVTNVYVAGQCRLHGRQHLKQQTIANDFAGCLSR